MVSRPRGVLSYRPLREAADAPTPVAVVFVTPASVCLLFAALVMRGMTIGAPLVFGAWVWLRVGTMRANTS
jgi:hypothetical protein